MDLLLFLGDVAVLHVDATAEFRRDPEAMRQQMGGAGGTGATDDPRRAALENRILQSNEPFATFDLTNSLAAFLAGPLALLAAMGKGGGICRSITP